MVGQLTKHVPLHPYLDEGKTERALRGEPDHELLQPEKAYVDSWSGGLEKQAKKAWTNIVSPISGNIGPRVQLSLFWITRFLFRTNKENRYGRSLNPHRFINFNPNGIDAQTPVGKH